MKIPLPELIEEKIDGYVGHPSSNLRSVGAFTQVETKGVEQEIVNLIIEGLRARKLTEGALVVSKKVPQVGRTVPNNWGLITHLNEYAQKGAIYKPLVVQWLSGSRQEMHEEDLLLVQAPPSPDDLKLLLTCTG